jgi:hypothetical protein
VRRERVVEEEVGRLSRSKAGDEGWPYLYLLRQGMKDDALVWRLSAGSEAVWLWLLLMYKKVGDE